MCSSDLVSVFTADLMAEASHTAFAEFIGSAAERPLGIMAASDVIAMTTLRLLADIGLSVPDELKVIGYGGLELTEYTIPRLSAVRQDLTAGANHLVDVLLRRIAGEDTEPVILRPELVQRTST